MIDMSANQVNQDELILEQQRKIEKEIAETTPLIGERETFHSLEEMYENDEIYLHKVEELKSQYSALRKTRGDGNCFFRAFIFAYLEVLITDREECKRFKDYAVKTKDELVSLGFPQFTIEDFYEMFLEVVNKVENGIPVEDLLELLNDNAYSNYVVVYMRLLTSGHLQKEADFYMNFIEGDVGIKEFCSQEVEPMYKESDHIHIIALTSATGVGVRVQYMDRGEGKLNSHDFPEGCTPKVHLLYRPGHYDVLYP